MRASEPAEAAPGAALGRFVPKMRAQAPARRYLLRVLRRPFLLAASLGLVPFVALAGDQTQVTFMGFQTFADQTSRIFVHMTKRTGVTLRTEPGQVVFTLGSAILLARNNKNPLALEHFATPAKRARLVQSGNDVEVVIELKRQVEVEHRLAEADGKISLQVDLPAAPMCE